MNIEEIRDYCLSKPGTSEDFPFDESTLVFKVKGKMFVLTDLVEALSLNLKCDPERAISLREEYPSITPGYHMHKKYWNTVSIDGSLSRALILELIDHSYEQVVSKLPGKLKQELKEEASQ